ncbi:MAG: hypothetical protein JXP34_02140 [Planctomycetes bacterium]|nr:hypothetical protein [Planctomycetota bacterium]
MIAIFTIACLSAAAPDAIAFDAAKPVWPAGRETEKNLSVLFRADFDAPAGERVILRLTASTLYRATLDGEFLGHGPARGPHGFYRVDEWNLTDRLRPGTNAVAIEVAGYNANSYYLLDQPSFLQAEVVAGGKVLAATGAEVNPFAAAIVTERLQKVQRYSFQRPFSEVYRLKPDVSRPPAKLALQPPKALLPRRVPYPTFDLRPPVWDVARGTLKAIEPSRLWKDRSLTAVGPALGGYPEKDLEIIPSIDLQRIGSASREEIDRPLDAGAKIALAKGAYRALDFGTNLTGFIGARIVCREPARVFFTFDEILSDGDVAWRRLGCVNIISLLLAPGTYEVESFEPYTLRYLKILALDGACEVDGIYLREYVNPDVWEAHFAASDPRLNVLFAAGRETFRQNALDIFMDCPSRERAGWLCDSFFTSRVAVDLSGDTRIEKNFLENFALPPSFAFLPDGMLPMCYPADHNDRVFIPNWALWFVVELEEYARRSGDRTLVESLRPRVLRLFEYFEPFRNSDGLLEKLQSWVFVEWSKANEFVQDVNYPSNMLYAGALAAAGRMYGLEDLVADAARIRETIREQSFDGTFFVDNAVRKDGALQVTRNRSEVCQYFAFFFDVATPESHPDLWKTLCERFGPKRGETKAFPEVHAANAFIGNMLRFENLSRYGRCRQILDESIEYLLYMADRTGTLWENVGAYASCNHGFASHIVHTLYRDVLGIRAIRPQEKVVELSFSDPGLEWCEGRIPLDGGPVALRWWKEGGKILFRAEVPPGWSIRIENRTGGEVIRRP